MGTKLMERAEEVAKENGVKEIGVYVDAKNGGLINFYENRGYKSSKKPWLYMYKSVE